MRGMFSVSASTIPFHPSGEQLSREARKCGATPRMSTPPASPAPEAHPAARAPRAEPSGDVADQTARPLWVAGSPHAGDGLCKGSDEASGNSLRCEGSLDGSKPARGSGPGSKDLWRRAFALRRKP